jgi:hypothetical protein
MPFMLADDDKNNLRGKSLAEDENTQKLADESLEQLC